MPYFLIQASYARDQIKGLTASPQNRAEEAGKLVEALGGKMHHMFFAFGDYDIVAIGEMPDNASMAAMSMAVSGAGTTSTFKTTVLLSMDEAIAAMEKAGSASGYKPPSG